MDPSEQKLFEKIGMGVAMADCWVHDRDVILKGQEGVTKHIDAAVNVQNNNVPDKYTSNESRATKNGSGMHEAENVENTVDKVVAKEGVAVGLEKDEGLVVEGDVMNVTSVQDELKVVGQCMGSELGVTMSDSVVQGHKVVMLEQKRVTVCFHTAVEEQSNNSSVKQCMSNEPEGSDRNCVEEDEKVVLQDGGKDILSEAKGNSTSGSQKGEVVAEQVDSEMVEEFTNGQQRATTDTNVAQITEVKPCNTRPMCHAVGICATKAKPSTAQDGNSFSTKPRHEQGGGMTHKLLEGMPRGGDTIVEADEFSLLVMGTTRATSVMPLLRQLREGMDRLSETMESEEASRQEWWKKRDSMVKQYNLQAGEATFVRMTELESVVLDVFEEMSLKSEVGAHGQFDDIPVHESFVEAPCNDVVCYEEFLPEELHDNLLEQLPIGAEYLVNKEKPTAKPSTHISISHLLLDLLIDSMDDVFERMHIDDCVEVQVKQFVLRAPFPLKGSRHQIELYIAAVRQWHPGITKFITSDDGDNITLYNPDYICPSDPRLVQCCVGYNLPQRTVMQRLLEAWQDPVLVEVVYSEIIANWRAWRRGYIGLLHTQRALRPEIHMLVRLINMIQIRYLFYEISGFVCYSAWCCMLKRWSSQFIQWIVLSNFSAHKRRHWNPGIHNSNHETSHDCLAAKVLESNWAIGNEHRGVSSADHSVAWGQATFGQSGSVRIGPCAMLWAFVLPRLSPPQPKMVPVFLQSHDMSREKNRTKIKTQIRLSPSWLSSPRRSDSGKLRCAPPPASGYYKLVLTSYPLVSSFLFLATK